MKHSRQWRISAVAECNTCGEEWQDWRTATKLAGAHARKTGHCVRAETATVIYWNERAPDAGRTTDGKL